MTDQFECQFCGKKFEFSSDKNEHERTCGISRLSDYGIEVETLDKIDDADLEQDVDSSRQLQLDEMPIGRCPVCGKKILESDNYNGIEKYKECRNCEKVVHVRDIDNA